MNSEWEDVFYPGKHNKWSKYKTNMWKSMEESGYWTKNVLWYDAHYEYELRDKSSAIPISYKQQYKPNKQIAKLIPI